MIGFRMPTHVHIEPGAFGRLPEAARRLGLQSALLVVDPGIRDHTDLLKLACENLESTGFRVRVFDAVEPNPRTSTVTAAGDVLRADQLDGVIALGGGSVIDAAKAAAMLATNSQRIEQYEGKDRYTERPKPFIAIPTTCGTGSEVTWVSVLTHEPTRSKISVKGETMFPDQALVDADLLKSLPPHMVAWTGVDALTHAVECITCLAANAVSDALAIQAVRLLFQYLPRAVADIESDAEAREAVMRASTLAGLAFGNADVAAVHCLSEALGGLYDVPHGLANAILLAPIMRYHRRAALDRLAWIDKHLHCTSALEPVDSSDGPSDGERADRFLDDLEGLCKRLEIPSFNSLKVPGEDHDIIAAAAVRNGSNRSNPQPMSPTSYREILSSLDGVG